jgi:hypothetical protein
MRDQTDRILLEAAAAGASIDDLATILATIAACAIEAWRAQQPDADEPDPGDRYVQLGTTFGGAGVIRGDLTPECAAVVRPVLEALGKKAGPGKTTAPWASGSTTPCSSPACNCPASARSSAGEGG